MQKYREYFCTIFLQCYREAIAVVKTFETNNILEKKKKLRLTNIFSLKEVKSIEVEGCRSVGTE